MDTGCLKESFEVTLQLFNCNSQMTRATRYTLSTCSELPREDCFVRTPSMLLIGVKSQLPLVPTHSLSVGGLRRDTHSSSQSERSVSLTEVRGNLLLKGSVRI